MIAVDTNILIYAHRREVEWHGAAVSCMDALMRGRAPWAIPWPCLHEFLAIVTHPRIYAPPSPAALALEQVEVWTNAPGNLQIGETHGHVADLKALILSGRIAGPRVHDAKIAAICLRNCVMELLTADRDFSRFPDLKTRNPLVT